MKKKLVTVIVYTKDDILKATIQNILNRICAESVIISDNKRLCDKMTALLVDRILIHDARADLDGVRQITEERILSNHSLYSVYIHDPDKALLHDYYTDKMLCLNFPCKESELRAAIVTQLYRTQSDLIKSISLDISYREALIRHYTDEYLYRFEAAEEYGCTEYLKYALYKMLTEPEKTGSAAGIYRLVSEKFNVSAKTAERQMNLAIRHAYFNTKFNFKSRILENRIKYKQKLPSPYKLLRIFSQELLAQLDDSGQETLT